MSEVEIFKHKATSKRVSLVLLLLAYISRKLKAGFIKMKLDKGILILVERRKTIPIN